MTTAGKPLVQRVEANRLAVLRPSDYHAILSGRRKDVSARLLRAGLRACEPIYGLAVCLRNRRYDTWPARAHRLDVPVVSVGNLTTGGTGKTPLVITLAQWAFDDGKHPILLSRGYKGTPEGNDEAAVIRLHLPQLVHLQDQNRVRAAQAALQTHRVDLFLLDDGFQHRRLHRDADIVLLDALAPFGFGHLLPRGLLREPKSSLRRADALVLSRADLVEGERRRAVRREAERAAGRALPWAEIRHRPGYLRSLPQENGDAPLEPVERLRDAAVVGFCGLGSPTGFRRTLESLGARILAFCEFPDHHRFSEQDVIRLIDIAHNVNADCLVCTEKDLVKLASFDWADMPVKAVGIEIEFLAGESELRSLFRAAIGG
ncbi:tetraacyldisaccharide 4'-kinase [Thermostilla marina]